MEIKTQKRKGKVHLSVMDNGHVVAHAEGDTVPEAAKWLVHQVDRIAQQTGALVVEMGLLTEAQVEDIIENGMAY